MANLGIYSIYYFKNAPTFNFCIGNLMLMLLLFLSLVTNYMFSALPY